MLRDTLWFVIGLGVPVSAGLLATSLKRRQGYYEWYAQQFGVKVGAIASIITMITMRMV